MYSRCIIFGTGSLAAQCFEYISKKGIRVTFVETGNAFSGLSTKMNRGGEMMECDGAMKLIRAAGEPLLVLNIGSMKIVPGDVLAIPHHMFVNYHNSLLPLYKGRNAEAWVIYNRESATGVTWHRMAPEIDCGDIISQELLPLTDAVTSLKLLQLQAKIAFKSFMLFFDELWAGKCVAVPQRGSGNRVYYAREKPNGGVLDIRWDAEHISAFLRAMDYGFLHSLGKGALHLDGAEYGWNGYAIEACRDGCDDFEIAGATLVIRKSGKRFVLKEIYTLPPTGSAL